MLNSCLAGAQHYLMGGGWWVVAAASSEWASQTAGGGREAGDGEVCVGVVRLSLPRWLHALVHIKTCLRIRL